MEKHNRNTMEWQMNGKSERKKIEEEEDYEITTRKSYGNTRLGKNLTKP